MNFPTWFYAAAIGTAAGWIVLGILIGILRG